MKKFFSKAKPGLQLVAGNDAEVFDAHEKLKKYLEESQGAYSEETFKAQRSDLNVYSRWCKERGYPLLPVLPDTLAKFIDNMATTRKEASIRRYISTIRTLNTAAGFTDPYTIGKTVKLALRRLRLLKAGEPIKQAKPLRWDELETIINSLPDTLKGKRDRALLLVAYDTMCRISELVRMEFKHIDYKGKVMVIPYTKGKQTRDAQFRALSDLTIAALKAWQMALYPVDSGPIWISFRGPTAGKSLCSRAIYGMMREHGYTGHSARVGSAVDQGAHNIATSLTAHSGGWKTETMVIRYQAQLNASESGAARLSKLQGRST